MNEIRHKDQVIVNLVLELRKMEKKLQQMLENAKNRLKLMENANNSPVDVNQLVAYASYISGTTSAPPEYPPGFDTTPKYQIFQPPMPQEKQFLASCLQMISTPGVKQDQPSELQNHVVPSPIHMPQQPPGSPLPQGITIGDLGPAVFQPIVKQPSQEPPLAPATSIVQPTPKISLGFGQEDDDSEDEDMDSDED
jgi:hypothetical protein